MCVCVCVCVFVYVCVCVCMCVMCVRFVVVVRFAVISFLRCSQQLGQGGLFVDAVGNVFEVNGIMLTLPVRQISPNGGTL